MGALLPDGPIDTLGVLAAIEATAEAVASALEIPVPTTAATVRGIVLVASGADVLVAHAAQALVAPRSPVPVFVHDEAGLPGFVSDEWLVVFVSRQLTEEAMSALHAAVDHRASLAAVGSGPVVEVAAERDATVLRMVDEVPAARFSFASTLVATLRFLDAHGAIVEPVGDGGLVADAEAAIIALEGRRRSFAGADEAATLARRLGRTMPLVYSSGPIGAVAARRWKQQVNDNAKAPAFAAALPGLAHHELNGWGQHGDMTRQVFSLVLLRHDHEREADEADFDRVTAMLDEVVHAHHVVEAQGSGPLAQLLDLCYVGDMVSYHLAQQNEIDPGPTTASPPT